MKIPEDFIKSHLRNRESYSTNRGCSYGGWDGYQKGGDSWILKN